MVSLAYLKSDFEHSIKLDWDYFVSLYIIVEGINLVWGLHVTLAFISLFDPTLHAFLSLFGFCFQPSSGSESVLKWPILHVLLRVLGHLVHAFGTSCNTIFDSVKLHALIGLLSFCFQPPSGLESVLKWPILHVLLRVQGCLMHAFGTSCYSLCWLIILHAMFSLSTYWIGGCYLL